MVQRESSAGASCGIACGIMLTTRPLHSLTVQWMFINTPATERRVLRFFRLRWNAAAIQFFLERDETGETPILIYRRDATGQTILWCLDACTVSPHANRVSPALL